jgi:ribosomal-protein-alanine N-acetyltransferase
MNFEIINTDRLILRRLSPNDFKYIYENYSEEEIKKLLGHNSDEEFLKEKVKYENGYTTYNRSFEYFQILDSQSKCIIGGCGFHNWYIDHRRAELGYSITNENFKRKGIMSEALKAVIDHGFHKMNLHRIEALVGSENIASLKLMKKYNFIKEGVLRQHFFIAGKFENSVVFSKLKSD